jgi:hypothetical protein
MSLAPALEASNAIYRPLGDHRGVAAPSKSVNCTGFEPSLSQTQICNVPVLLEVNAMRLPSGEYCGLVSSRVEEINLVGALDGPTGLLFVDAGPSTRQTSSRDSVSIAAARSGRLA